MTTFLLALIVFAALAAGVLAWKGRQRDAAKRPPHKQLPRGGGYVILLGWLAIPLLIFGINSAYALAFFLAAVPVAIYGITHELRGRS